MAYEVFARKYRPRVFDDLIGQEAIAQTLRHAVASGRTGSVYLFAGSHGVGKTSVARIFAKALNCPQAKDGAPCGVCEVCESIARGDCLDVVEIDAASNSKVEDVRLLRDSVSYKPASCKFKVYILDEVHRLSTSAFDALLKTFEESPPLVRFVLATTELHKVPTTILSRAQVFRFQRAGLDDIVRSLQRIVDAEKIAVEGEALRVVARRARGSMRDSQKLLDQVVALAGGKAAAITAADVAFLLGDATADVVARLLRAIVEGDAGALLRELEAHVRAGGRPDALGADLMEGLRGALYLKTAGEGSPLLDDVALGKEDLRPVAGALSEEALLYALQLLQEAQMNMREVRDPRLALELVLVRLARARELIPVGEVLARLQRLEAALGGSGGGGPTRPAAPARPAVAPAASAPAASAPAPSAPPVSSPPVSSPPVSSPPVSSPPVSSPAAPRPEAPRAAPAPAPPSAPPPAARMGYEVPPELSRRAPAPVAATAAPAAASTIATAEPVTFEAVLASWDKVRQAGKQQSVSFGRTLDRSRPKSLSGRRLVIEASVANFIFSSLDTPAFRDPLLAILRDVLGGASLELSFERGMNASPLAESGPHAVAGTPASGSGGDRGGAASGGAGPGPAGAAPVASAAGSATRSVYEEPIVKHAQRVLGSQSTAGGW